MARYIDADALIENMRNRKYIDKALCEIFETVVDEQPTAYDVEAKVAEMEKVAFERFGNDGMGGQKVVTLDDAISIVRGKE